MLDIFPINSICSASLSQEFSQLQADFDKTFWTNANGSTNLVATLTEAQQAYYKMLQIGSAPHPNDEACVNAILDGLTAREFILASIIVEGAYTYE